MGTDLIREQRHERPVDLLVRHAAPHDGGQVHGLPHVGTEVCQEAEQGQHPTQEVRA